MSTTLLVARESNSNTVALIQVQRLATQLRPKRDDRPSVQDRSDL
ncbi:hypothetical protein [Caballeronia sp. SEWSISQ10-4 2]|nr:hypothetical protein [Caballeronia sp. SEWSISQ10-4 2]